MAAKGLERGFDGLERIRMDFFRVGRVRIERDKKKSVFIRSNPSNPRSNLNHATDPRQKTHNKI